MIDDTYLYQGTFMWYVNVREEAATLISKNYGHICTKQIFRKLYNYEIILVHNKNEIF